MATDAVIQFNYSDKVPLAFIYKRTDAFPDILAEAFIGFLNKIDKEELHKTGRVNYPYLVARLISDFVRYVDRIDGVKIVPAVMDDDHSFIYRWIVTPIEELYVNQEIPLIRALNFQIKFQSSDEDEFNGFLPDFDFKDE